MKSINFKELIRVYSLIEKRKIQYFISIIFTGLAYPCLNIIFSFAYKESINAIEFNEYSLFINTCILFLFAVIIQCLIEPFANFYNARLVNIIIYNIRKKVFKHAINLPVTYFETNHSGDTILRLTSNIDAIEPIYRGGFRDIMQAIFYGIGALISMMVLSYKLAICSLVFSIIAYIVNRSFTKVMRKFSKIQQEQNSQLVQSFVTTYSCGNAANMFSKGNVLANNFTETNKNIMKTSIQIMKKRILKNNLSSIVSNLSTMVVLVYGLIMAMNNQIDIGSIVSIISLQGGLTGMFISLGSFFANMQGNLANISRVFEILDTPMEKQKYEIQKASNIEEDDIISLENVSFSYEEDKNVIDGITINIKENKILSIVGPNGSGKSTLMKLLLGFYQPKGNVAIRKQAFSNFFLSEIRDNISYVSQQPVLFSTTILENIQFGKPNATMDEIINAAKMANIHEDIISLEDGYNSIVGEDGAFLSGGQRQRIAIARALIKNAPIILFDEATSSLDVENEFDIMQSLKNVIGRYTVIIITHRLKSIQDSDWIFVLNRGQIVEQGNHTKLQTNNGFYKELYDLQSTIME